MDKRKPSSCFGCPLAEIGEGFLGSEGTCSNGVLIIGEAAGKHEAAQGLPFRPNAPAGGYLEKIFHLARIPRKDFGLFNIVNCKPPANDLVGAEYEAGAIEHCRPNVDDAIRRLRPKILLALGNTALRSLTGNSDYNISGVRGYVLKSTYGLPLIASYHPSFLIRNMEHLTGVALHDIRVAAQYARTGVPTPLPTAYNLTPSIADVEAYIERLEQDASLVLSYDCETSEILGLKGPSDWRRKIIVQMQFSTAIGEAIVLPYEGEYIGLSKRIMAMQHDKVGWNSRLSDDLVLKANGFVIGGEHYDAMLMFSHLQPSFSSGKDAKEGDDKGVPSRLLNLQSAVSFYYPYEPLYKTTMRRGIGTDIEVTDGLWADIRYGGSRDTDFTLRLATKFIATLRSQGLWNGFYRYKHRLGQVLSAMSDRGLPIDRTEQRKLRQSIEWQELLLERELQGMIPDELRPLNKKGGYKGFPKDLREAVKAAGLWVKCCRPEAFPEQYESLGYKLGVFELETPEGECYTEQRLCKLLPFNADSPKQVMAYIEHQVDTVGHPWFIPRDVDSKKPTTNKAGMESLILLTDDPTLKQIRKCKKIGDLKAYCEGKWIPQGDGCVHAEFRVGATATGQTSATNPPIQTYPKHVDPADEWLVPTIKRIKSIIKATEGHTMVEVDARGFHARVQGHLSGDPIYYRMADFDIHSYNTAYYMHEPDADQLRHMEDGQLRSRLAEIKEAHKYERNFILKRIAFLRQFAGGAEKAATIMKVPVIEVMQIFNMMDELFKLTFKTFPTKVKRMLQSGPRLTSAFGCIRYFWDGDPQQAIAFLPANSAHCMIQDAMIRLHDRGALAKYHAVDFVHDSVWFMCPTELVDECIATTKEEFERPSDVLVSETLGPFFVHADASIGPSMGELRDYE